MSDIQDQSIPSLSTANTAIPGSGTVEKAGKPRGRWLRRFGILLVLLAVILGIARLLLPNMLQWYVNRTINRSELYEGRISSINVHLIRGFYSINDIKLVKKTGNVPIPLFSAPRVDLAMQWNALFSGKLVGRVVMESPELNFVDAKSDANSQIGAGGPWLEMLTDLFPFKINSADIHGGSIHFHALDTKPPVNVYLSHLEASVENLTNIHDDVTPLVAVVKANALAMDQARFEYEMKLNPFSYRPTFETAVRLIGLDVTKTNDLARAYGDFDFEHGWFDLVVELNSKEGAVEGTVKPIFRDLKVLSIRKDIKEDNVLNFFWEALLGVTTNVLKNQPRNQFATLVPIRGTIDGAKIDLLAVLGNVLRNAFIRAYLPRLEGLNPDINGLEFGTGSVTDPTAVGQNH